MNLIPLNEVDVNEYNNYTLAFDGVPEVPINLVYVGEVNLVFTYTDAGIEHIIITDYTGQSDSCPNSKIYALVEMKTSYVNIMYHNDTKFIYTMNTVEPIDPAKLDPQFTLHSTHKVEIPV